MTVRELREALKKFDQDLTVAYDIYSEHKILEVSEIHIRECQPARDDGWVPDKRPDMPVQKYLMFPGN